MLNIYGGHRYDKSLQEIFSEAKRNINGLSSRFINDRVAMEAIFFTEENITNSSVVKHLGGNKYEFNPPDHMDFEFVYCLKKQSAAGIKGITNESIDLSCG